MKYDAEGRLLVSLERVDRIIDADGDTYAIAAEDYIDFFAAGTRYARIDANGLLVTEYLRHYDDPDTHLRFTDDRLRVFVGNVNILDITEAATDTVVWNEGGVDIDFRWEGVGHPNAFFIQGSDGKIGIGTNTIPHGGIGYAMLALDGVSGANGPHIQITTTGDNHPALQILSWGHDWISFNFDCYYDGAWKSSDVGSNFVFTKDTDLLRMMYDSGVAQGGAVTLNNGIALDTSGKVFINDITNTKALGPSLTIDGKGQDGEYLTLQDSTDVTHGITTETETDTFGLLKKYGATDGGILMYGYTDAKVGIGLATVYTVDDTTKNVNALFPVSAIVYKKSGTTSGDVGDDANIFGVRCRKGGVTVSVFFVDEDGDLFADGGVASTNMVTLYDDYEDAELVRAFDIARSRGQLVKSQFDRFLKYNEDKLVELGILGDTVANGGLTNVTRLQQLHNGAIWQNYCYIKNLVKSLAKHLGVSQKELLALEAN